MCHASNEKRETSMTDGIELPNQNYIGTLREKETYKWLGILEAYTINQVEMKDKIKKECLRRSRKLLETKLYSRNLIKGINTRAVPLVRYSGHFLKWTKEELEQMDQRTRKLMTMHKALCPRDDVDRLYVSKKEGRRGLTSTEDSIYISIQRLEDYIEKPGGKLITATRNKTDNSKTNRTVITRKPKLSEKQLDGCFKRLKSDISHEKMWTWLRKGILKTQQNSRCRLCGERDKTINHRISECSKLAKKVYKNRYDWLGKVIHWEFCKNLKFDLTSERYMHNPAPGIVNEAHKLFRDFEIQTDHQISARWPDLVIIKKKKKENLQKCGLCCPNWPQSKIERKWKEG